MYRTICILFRGTSNNTSKAVFRESYSCLHELRGLAPAVKVLALTATATSTTKKAIIDILMMNPFVIYESPSKPNIAYSVVYMPREVSLDHYFEWLSNELSELGTKTTRTIIYCQTIKQCALIYSTIKGMLGPKMYIGETEDRRNVLLEMLHSCTPKANKEAILKAFQDKNSGIRVLVATIAFGMGVDCKGVCRTIHFGPSKNTESYIQESGRAGRDDKQSVAFILYHGLLLNHVEKDMKQYVKTEECRRKTLLNHFDTSSEVKYPEPLHLCCDNCASKCKCGASDCGEMTKFPGINEQENKTTHSTSTCRTREVKHHQKDAVSSCLISYHKSLVNSLISKSAHGQLKTSTNLQFILGFSEQQISQVLDNCEKIFSLEDVCNYVEIWDMQHAHEILNIVSQTFGDCCDIQDYDCQSDDTDDDEHDTDTWLGDWHTLLDDDELLDLAVENLSLSLLDVSMNVSNDKSMDGVDIPGAVVSALEHFTL